MTPERWSQVRDLFDSALEVPAFERSTWLTQKTGEDEELRREVENLLHSFEGAPQFLERPPAAVEDLHKAVEAIPDPYVGRHIGPYEILQRLGRGGMGSVYAAIRSDGQYRKMVALKLVNPGADTEEIVQRFRTERQVLAALEHPNIARFLDGGATPEGLPYLVMEYVEGTTVDRYCQSHALSVNDRLNLFRTICDAVHYAHQNLVIHRDLKPANILVTEKGVVKLLDFGIAKLVRTGAAGGATVGLTRMGPGPLTPDYASPEQIRGDPMTTASDVYSLGVLLYQMLTGQLPFRTGTQSAAEVERIICQTLPAPPSATVELPEEARQRLKGDLDMILLMALRKEPSRRYPSAERLADDIRRHLEGEPVSAQKDTWQYRVGKFVSRNRYYVATAGVGLLALLVALGVSLHYWQVAKAKSQLAEERFQGGRRLIHFVMVELDDALAEGTTSARQRLVSQGIPYLDRLARDAGGDPSIQKDLVQAYVKMGDIQGSLFEAHIGQPGEALRCYDRGHAISEALMAALPRDEEARLLAARVHLKLGNFRRYHGEPQVAKQEYQRAAELLAAIEEQRALPAVLEVKAANALQTGTLATQMGDAQGALKHAQESYGYAQAWLAQDRSSEAAQLATAMSLEWSGRFLGDLGRTAEGIPKVRQAIAVYQRIAEAQDNTARSRRHLLVGYQQAGDLLEQAGQLNEAAVSYRQALTIAEDLVSQDPHNHQYQRDLHTSGSRLLSPLSKLGKKDEARAVTRRTLQVLEPLVMSPEATEPDLYQYGWLLATTPFPEFRKPAVALEYANRVMASSKGSDPWALNLLANAYAAAGRKSEAIETETKALALLPADPNNAIRKEFEENLSRWSALPGPKR